jgi:ADP-dependent NAD(P)H-hydrate dehydratase
VEAQSLPLLPPRPENSHKGDFGNALLIGGSRGMSGAIALSGMAAARAGAGLVRLAVPDCCLETVAGYSPCPMLVPLPHDAAGRLTELTDELRHWLIKSNCVAIGPGLGRSELLTRLLSEVLRFLGQENCQCPLVVDADGLFALSSSRHWRDLASNPLMLTPHPGEWARFCGVAAEEREEQCAAAVSWASRWNCTILLKGHRTWITNGVNSVVNSTGTPAMATGGSGDVLTGVVTALICQKMSVFNAARLGAHVHGLAGQIASEERQSHVVLPTELVHFLPTAFSKAV